MLKNIHVVAKQDVAVLQMILVAVGLLVKLTVRVRRCVLHLLLKIDNLNLKHQLSLQLVRVLEKIVLVDLNVAVILAQMVSVVVILFREVIVVLIQIAVMKFVKMDVVVLNMLVNLVRKITNALAISVIT